MRALALSALFCVLACSHDALRRLPCTDASDCTDGMVCADNFCEPAAAPTSADAGETVDAGEAPDAGTIASACRGTSDCAGGTVCRGGTCGACLSSAECAEGTCESGVCQICSGDVCPIDPTCDAPDGGTGETVFPPPGDPLPETVPANCLDGFEMNNLEQASYVIEAKTDRGSRALVLEVDFATYRAPDSLAIRATDGSGASTELLRTCHLQTATYADPVRQGGRPPQDSIREFRIPLAKGTRTLTFDFTGANSPNYLRVLGLCDFDLVPPTESVHWSEVTSR